MNFQCLGRLVQYLMTWPAAAPAAVTQMMKLCRDFQKSNQVSHLLILPPYAVQLLSSLWHHIDVIVFLLCGALWLVFSPWNVMFFSPYKARLDAANICLMWQPACSISACSLHFCFVQTATSPLNNSSFFVLSWAKHICQSLWLGDEGISIYTSDFGYDDTQWRWKWTLYEMYCISNQFP